MRRSKGFSLGGFVSYIDDRTVRLANRRDSLAGTVVEIGLNGVALNITPTLGFEVPVRTSNPLNGQRGISRWASIKRSREARNERDVARWHTRAALGRSDPSEWLPMVVSLTRFSRGILDPHDGLPAALKHVVDGIADVFAINDGGPLVQWIYRQERRTRPGVRVEITKKVTNATMGPIASLAGDVHKGKGSQHNVSQRKRKRAP